ncbi:MAG TPA: hypothetical protein VGT40_18920 [Methylomirabilota bacterium]|nr:hypothetical protein [Methylomirabilota bacterium]
MSYVNPEFSDDGRYMIWFEGIRMLPDSRLAGWVWQSGVNPETGELDPPDGKGFKAFEGTITGRANPGMDSRGVFYMGVDVDGRFVLARPNGPSAAQVTVLPTPPDVERRAIYPTSLQGREGGYVYWLKSHGSPYPGQAEWVELHYMDISHPDRTVVVERQEKPRFRWAPLDVVFSYWFPGAAKLIYGVKDGQGHLQVKELDATGQSPPRLLTNDPVDHINPKPFIFKGKRYLFSGIDRTAKSIVYVESAPGQPFAPLQTITVEGSALQRPCLAQSHEPFEFRGRLYTTFQLSDCGRAGLSFFTATGEVWLAEVEGNRRQWRISHAGDDVKNEPEPLVGRDHAWIFYSAYPKGGDPRRVVHQLWRMAVPSD